jgi:hypothetical protein
MDIEKLTFDWLLPEKLRTIVEKHGNVEVDARQMKSLTRTKPGGDVMPSLRWVQRP